MRHAARAAFVLALLATACRPDSVRTPGPREVGSWRVIADGPLRPGYGHEAVWTGDEMLVWGGSRVDPETLRAVGNRGGAAYDPATDTWRKIPDAPIRGGGGYSVTWTGDEMVVWGDPDGGRATKGNRAAAFDPETNTWRRLDPGPLAPRSGAFVVWTGDELVVWGGYLTKRERESYDGEGAAFDPETGSWRRLPEAPLPAGYDAMGAWTGTEVIVLASPPGTGADDYPKFAEAAAYDPARSSWRDIDDPPFVTHVSPPAAYLDDKLMLLSLGGSVDGGEVDGYGKSYETGGVYDVRAGEWRSHAPPPAAPNQTWEHIALEDEVVLDGLAYDPARDAWRILPKFPLRAREFPAMAWTGSELIVWGGAARSIGDPPPPLADGAAYTPPR